MSVCGPSNVIPSCAATPSVGFGSRNRGFGRSYSLGSHCFGLGSSGFGLGSSGFGLGSSGFGLGSSGFGQGSSGYGLGSIGYGLGSGATVSAASLGVLHGLRPSAINQLPPSEVVIQPQPFCITVPGAILAASPEQLCVGGYSPCSSGSSSGFGYGGGSAIGSGQRYSQGLLGSSLGSVGRGITCNPYN